MTGVTANFILPELLYFWNLLHSWLGMG